MISLHEPVALPDSSVQAMVHPLDVAEGRGVYRRAWLMSVAGSAHVLVLLGASAWALTGHYLAPALAVVSTGAIAEVVRRHT